MCTKKEGFHQRSKGGDLEKSKFLGLGGVFETSNYSTTLKKVEILSTLIYFQLKAVLREFGCVDTLRGCLACLVN